MISIFTPTHNTKYILEVYESLKEQIFSDWEWVIVLNNGAIFPKINDNRIKIYNFESNKVGALKRYACEKCNGEILVELDHDDFLTPDALFKIKKAFDENNCSMVYSNCANIDMNWNPKIWNPFYGWKFRKFNYKNHELIEIIQGKPTAHNVSRIWYAPNHVRAWRTKDYFAIGGHNAEMKIADDHDLICRTYLYGNIYHIDECLYIYRMHNDNTWLQNVKEIQSVQWANYNKYIYSLVEKDADKQNLLKIDLCGGIDQKENYCSIDIKNANIIANLNNKWPLNDNSVGVIRAHDAIEHLKNPIHTMNEAYRVLAHGGVFMIEVPSTDGVGAWCDPTHVSFWNIRSFKYYTEKKLRKYIEPECNCKFQIMKLINENKYDNIPYVIAHLIAIKQNEFRFHGELQI